VATKEALRNQLGMLAAAVLLAANVVVPLALGDVYPFTSAPMFRDTPQVYCNYHIHGPDGQPLPSERFLCHRIYDGNPVGYGVGVKPPKVLEEFGVAHDEATVREHISQQLATAENRGYDYVEVHQEVVGPVDASHVGVVRVDRWRIEVAQKAKESSDATTRAEKASGL
jgi:hypothetical protein